MKKVIFFITMNAWFGWNASELFSQNKNLNSATAFYDDYVKFNDPKSLTEAKEKIDLASVDEGTASKNKTWFYRGEIYLALFDFNLKNEIKKSSLQDVNQKLMESYKTIPSAELDEALKAYQQELELDEKKIYSDDARAKMKVISNHYVGLGDARMENKNYRDGMNYYEKAFDIKQKMNVTDTITLNNLAVAAVNLKEYKKAEEMYEKLIRLNYKPEKYYLQAIYLYNESGDTAAARKMVMRASEAMPESYPVLVEKINVLLKGGNPETALSSIRQAIEKNPNNPELHLVCGQTYNKMAFPKTPAGKDLPRPANFSVLVKNAEDEFTKAVELKPDYFVGLYSLGIFYNNVGVDQLRSVENIKDPKKLKLEEDKVDVIFKKAIPLLERAHDLDRSDKDVMRTLKQLYERTGQTGAEKYRKLDEEMK